MTEPNEARGACRKLAEMCSIMLEEFMASGFSREEAMPMIHSLYGSLLDTGAAAHTKRSPIAPWLPKVA